MENFCAVMYYSSPKQFHLLSMLYTERKRSRTVYFERETSSTQSSTIDRLPYCNDWLGRPDQIVQFKKYCACIACLWFRIISKTFLVTFFHRMLCNPVWKPFLKKCWRSTSYMPVRKSTPNCTIWTRIKLLKCLPSSEKSQWWEHYLDFIFSWSCIYLSGGIVLK